MITTSGSSDPGENEHQAEEQPRSLRARFGAASSGALTETREAWPSLTIYERFEQIIALILTLLISLVIMAAVAHLTHRIILLLLSGLVDPSDQAVFQALFGMVMTVLIALEFNHSVISVLKRKNSIVQVRTVVLIALLALVRKFIIIDATKVEPVTMLGLAAAVVALGAVYWLVRENGRMNVG